MSDHNSSDRCDATPAMGTAVSVSSGAAPPPLPAAAPSASNPEVASGAGAAARTGAGDGAGAGATGTGDKDDLFPARSARVATSRATGLVYDQRMRLHEDPTGPHPEQPDRISRIFASLQEAKLVERCKRVEARDVARRELLLVHEKAYLDTVDAWKGLATDELTHISYRYNSIFLNADSYMCAQLSAGSVVETTLQVCRGDLANAVAVVRPPGHHAEEGVAMGFCIYNNVAVAAAAALECEGINRVLIVDWDVHHGNGTQHMFEDNPHVLYFSVHRYDNGCFYPGSPDAKGDRVGVGAGAGYNINVALNNGTKGDGDYLYIWNHILMPMALEYDPDLVLVSAGFDAAYGDPLGGYKITPPGYSHLTHMLKSLAGGRVVVALEGGYKLSAISASMTAVTASLLGEEPLDLGRRVYATRPTRAAVARTMRAHAQYWHCLGKPDAEPDPVVIEYSSDSSSSSDDEDAGYGGPPGDNDVDDVLASDAVTSAPDAGAEAVAAATAAIAAMAIASPGGSAAAVADAGVDDASGGFRVQPLSFCEHVKGCVSKAPDRVDLEAKCEECDTVGQDNWVCLSCGKVLCGRYANSHMVVHGATTGHHVVGSFGDLSFWCYAHDNYLNCYMIPAVHEWYDRMHMARFGELPASSNSLQLEVVKGGEPPMDPAGDDVDDQ